MKATNAPSSITLDAKPGAVPQGFAPEGVAPAVFDEQTLYLVHHALPTNLRGVFAHLLYYATLDPRTSMQQSLFQVTGETRDEAIALISSVEALAKTPGSPCGPHTYLKVLLIMEALKIIRRTFHRTYTEIHIFVGKRAIHLPALLEALRQLHTDYRDKKVRQLARKVAKRLKSGEFAAYSAVPSATVSPGLEPVADVLISLLKEHGVGRVHVPSLTEACDLIAQALLAGGRVPAKKGEFIEGVRYQLHQTGAPLDDSDVVSGDSVGGMGRPSRKSRPKRGDLTQGSGDSVVQSAQEGVGESPQIDPLLGDSIAAESPTNAHSRQNRDTKRPKRGDSAAIFAMESPALAQNGSVSAQPGDSDRGVSISDHYLSLTNKERTLNDSPPECCANSPYRDTRPIEEIRAEARTYALFLDGHTHWMGKLITCIQQTPPAILDLAVVDTLYHTYFPDFRGKPQRPGAWFASRCTEYAQPGARIPEPVRQWADTGQSFQEIEEALRRGLHLPTEQFLPFGEGHDRSDLSANGAPDEETLVYPESASWARRPATPGESLLNTHMDHKTAEILRERIITEGRSFGLEARVAPAEREGEALVVVTWDGVDVDIVSPDDWVRYFADTKACFEPPKQRRGYGRE